MTTTHLPASYVSDLSSLARYDNATVVAILQARRARRRAHIAAGGDPADALARFMASRIHAAVEIIRGRGLAVPPFTS